MMKKLLSVLTAACLAGAAAVPALASDAETFVFRVDASALQTSSDVNAAYQRLSNEATRYCRALGLTLDRDLTECRVDVVENVVEAVGDERLSALHRNTTEQLRLAAAR